MKLEIVRSWYQVDGGVRTALATPKRARQAREILRSDPAMADYIDVDVIVDVAPNRGLRAVEWPGRRDGRRPDWQAIRAALADA